MVIVLFFFQYKLLSPLFHVQNTTPEISLEWKEMVGSGILCLGASLVLIYRFAKCIEEKRTLKYQDIQKFQAVLNSELLLAVKNKNEDMEKIQDTLNAELLLAVKNKNEDMEKIHEKINETLHKGKVIMYLAKSFYSKRKDKALKEIADSEPDLTAEMCEKLSRREAKIACKSYLEQEFNCSKEEVAEILDEIQSCEE